MKKTKIRSFVYVVLFLCWVVIVYTTSFAFILPFFPDSIPPIKVLNYPLALVCHQNPERCLDFCNTKLKLCTRCIAINVFFIVSSCVFSSMRLKGMSQRVIILFCIALILPLSFDVVFQFITLYNSATATRLLTGALFGIGGGVMYAYHSKYMV